MDAVSPLPLFFRGLGQIQDVSEGRRFWPAGATAEDEALFSGIFVKGARFAAERCGKVGEADATLMRDPQRGQMIRRPALASFVYEANDVRAREDGCAGAPHLPRQFRRRDLAVVAAKPCFVGLGPVRTKAPAFGSAMGAAKVQIFRAPADREDRSAEPVAQRGKAGVVAVGFDEKFIFLGHPDAAPTLTLPGSLHKRLKRRLGPGGEAFLAKDRADLGVGMTGLHEFDGALDLGVSPAPGGAGVLDAQLACPAEDAGMGSADDERDLCSRNIGRKAGAQLRIFPWRPCRCCFFAEAKERGTGIDRAA